MSVKLIFLTLRADYIFMVLELTMFRRIFRSDMEINSMVEKCQITGCVICTVNVISVIKDGFMVKVCSMFGIEHTKFCQET
jgi:hypothetical protein